MNIGGFSGNLEQDRSGIWVPIEAERTSISYPEGGHDACFELEDASFWFAHRNDVITLALQRHPFDGAFLDVGAGNGVVSCRLEAKGYRTVVLEPGEQGAVNARRRGLPVVVNATLDAAAFAPSSFGAAGLFDVIEHVEDDEALLRAVHRVLRPSGVLAVTVPAYPWLWSSEDELAGHYRRYTLGRLRAVLDRSGFHVQYATYFFAALTAPIFVARSLPHRLGRRRSRDDVEARAATDHVLGRGARLAMRMLLAPELRAIRAGRTVPVGTSCLAIARARR